MVLFRTPFGLRVRSVGENPQAAETLGIDVIRIRYTAVIIGGLIAGLAGAWFSLESQAGFEDNMTNGAGFIALAALIFGRWRPGTAFAGAMLFGFTRALGARLQILGVEVGDFSLPSELWQSLPFVVTIVVVAGAVGRATAARRRRQSRSSGPDDRARRDVDWEALRAEAAAGRRAAPTRPTPRFPVGAAALVDDGRIVVGCNVENASYGLSTLCAECGSCRALHATGGGRLVAVAVRRRDGRAAPAVRPVPAGAVRARRRRAAGRRAAARGAAPGRVRAGRPPLATAWTPST